MSWTAEAHQLHVMSKAFLPQSLHRCGSAMSDPDVAHAEKAACFREVSGWFASFYMFFSNLSHLITRSSFGITCFGPPSIAMLSVCEQIDTERSSP